MSTGMRLVEELQNVHNHSSSVLNLRDALQKAIDAYVVLLDQFRGETDQCCENESRDMNGGCKNCGDPCL
jgi:hypothetical protein